MRAYNFSGGPGALPDSVIAEAARAVEELPGTRVSILGLSHRSDEFAAMVREAEHNVRALLGIDASYRVLFLQGGGSLQFAMVPMHFLRGTQRTAEYIVSGYWSTKSASYARHEGAVRVLWSGEANRYTRVPRADELTPSADAAYLHYVSNETVEGVQFQDVPGLDSVPRVCDMSSDFLSRPHPMARFDLVYAHAQKNLGPAGVTLVVAREDVLAKDRTDVADVLRYRAHADHGSIYNTPPVFAIYVTLLVTRWLRHEIGGLAAMEKLNAEKALKLYGVLDETPAFFRTRVDKASRSNMNVTFHLPTAKLENELVEAAEQRGLVGIRGHRTVGGLRASLYNAVSLPAVTELTDLLREFRNEHA
jgi:phosphoserine aminotransferase